MANNRSVEKAPAERRTPPVDKQVPLETDSVLVLAHVFPRALEDSMGAFLLHLANALADGGLTTSVVAPHAPGLKDEEQLGAAHVFRFHYAPVRSERLAYTGTMHELVARGISAKLLFGLLNLAFLFKAVVVTRARRPKVLHAHWWLPGGLVGALTAALTGVPLVITTHGTDVEMLRQTRWVRRLARFAFGRARAVTCGSTYLKEQLLALGIVDRARVSVAPMPVNPLFQTGCLQRRSGAALVLTVARLTRQKKIDTLIAAMAIVRDHGCDARLAVIGEGPERGALEAQVQVLGLRDRVEFLGALPQQELPRQYTDCSVFVLPSIREGMGLVLAEALLCGAPVIGTNSGGIPDLVKDGETGLLVPEDNAPALAAAIETLLTDPALAQRLAAQGQAWTREHYTGETAARQFRRVYASVSPGIR